MRSMSLLDKNKSTFGDWYKTTKINVLHHVSNMIIDFPMEYVSPGIIIDSKQSKLGRKINHSIKRIYGY